MAYLTHNGVTNTTALSGSFWFYGSTFLQMLFRAGDGIGSNWNGTSISAYPSLFGMDIRQVTGFGGQGACNLAVTFFSAWNHIFFNFRNIGGGLISGEAAVNGVIHPSSSFNCTFMPDYIPLNDSGAMLGVPWDAAWAAAFPGGDPVRLGQYQLWLYQYIPVTTDNLNKFVSISGGIGSPQSIAVSNTAFGVPEICFTGGKSEFPTNQGTLGAFTTVGTLSNFTPLPTFTSS